MKFANEIDQLARQLLDAMVRMDAIVGKTAEVSERCESLERAYDQAFSLTAVI